MIRPARKDDAAAIDAVHRAAFGGEVEVRIAREAPPEISLVFVARDTVSQAVVGHVLLSRAHVEREPVLALGPIGVLPERQRRGIGTALMHAALVEADARGEPLAAYRPAIRGRFRYHEAFYPRR